MSKPSEAKLNVVVVGGGVGGAPVARALSSTLDASRFNLILVNPLPYALYIIAGARLVVSDIDSKLDETTKVPYDRLFIGGKGTFKQGSVVSVEKAQTGGTLVLEDGERLPFFALVVATGSKWAGPLDFPRTEAGVTQWLADRRAEFKKAENIVIGGGGAVGIELAGEIKDVWPNKPVTIVHNQRLLLNDTYPDKFRRRMEQGLHARGIVTVFEDSVGELAPGVTSITTQKGKTLSADLVVPSWGIKPNTSLLADLNKESEVLSANGFVKVRDTLQLPAHPDIFAVGDIIDVKEQKQAAKTGGHAAVVAANVVSFVNGQPLTKKYKGSYELILVTNGKNGGLAYFGVLWGLVFGDWFARMMKSKTLMVDRFRQGLGY
ncbi:FAD/NAD(P)-binding domain-containing protein [Cylindrobasidium torrendii FP15055 ss-10]|uniref:FAD/NAD(P)-binding domain-containing protein n=1 Tax=Cylindrobasidium torrendii FP15055 ss-10 TaxID=1314674 RepID=A0A0D7BFW8_9AGAR|nr:FAD/NAD(P)-binding domain-containing protein [Cylindrobasidium torrendii FP15055 ss-10]